MSQDAKFDYRVALLPVPEEGAARASALGEGDNVILASSDNPDEAFKFLEFLYARDGPGLERVRLPAGLGGRDRPTRRTRRRSRSSRRA